MVSKPAEAIRIDVPHNVLRAELGVTVREARFAIPGRHCSGLKWIVENNRTGASWTFDNPRDAEAFFEKEAGRNGARLKEPQRH